MLYAIYRCKSAYTSKWWSAVFGEEELKEIENNNKNKA